MTDIKFGTDGWRAIIGKEYTIENVARVAKATAHWLLKRKAKPSVVIGYDCRFGGELFAEAVAKVMAEEQIKVLYNNTIATTPMVSLGIRELKADLGVVITASHNPPLYSGYKLKGPWGGPLFDDDLRVIESYIPDNSGFDFDAYSLKHYIDNGFVEFADLETIYCKQVEASFDMEAIRNSGLQFAFDAMYGSGQNVMRRLLPDITFLHCEINPTFNNIPPEPLLKNLQEFSEVIRLSENIDCGLAVDGDADRIALFDNEGNYVDSHHILLLLIHYMKKYKGADGKVATAVTSTQKIKKLCKHYGLELEIVPIGFKHVSKLMQTENILVGGEESGGIAVQGHIPERDGIWNGLVIWEFMVKTGKSLRDIINEIYEITGSFAFERSDLKLDEELKQRIVAKCKNNDYQKFGPYTVKSIDTLDGFKYYFNDDEWLCIRPSGTEPVLRTYAESYTKEDALAILKACYDTIMQA
ncbi:MAG: Phosphoglucosamine mutase [Bacteroidetes bacterium ADurb.Bin408]|nr:MAG: Phosphoglucosamine mutase [Bacteroidetes bacterium ADurb.Bin408]